MTGFERSWEVIMPQISFSVRNVEYNTNASAKRSYKITQQNATFLSDI